MVVLFIVFLRISTAILSYLFSLNGHVKLLNGMVSSSSQLVIPQDPSVSNSILVNRSINKNGGIEFTWSLWCFIELYIVVNTFAEIMKTITVPNIPLSNWVQIVITCENNTINIYINGILIKSIILMSVINQNYGDVIIGSNGGYDGLISNLWYWNRTLSVLEIQNLFTMGPNTRTVDNMNDYKNKPGSNYLALSYYMQ